MSVLGPMRGRVTLMREEKSLGAGGRMVLATPIIADVWAEVQTRDGGAGQAGDRQQFGSAATFRTHAAPRFAGARRILWQGRTYRVQSYRTTGMDARFMEFSASEILGR